LLGYLTGCGAATVSSGTDAAQDRWACAQGGTLVDHRQPRCAMALARLGFTPADATILILNTDALSAFAWPNHRIFLTRALVDAATDDELAAAIGHELGHLYDADHLPAALSGPTSPVSHDPEVVADSFAVRLLNARHIPPAALASLLSKARAAASSSDHVKQALARRIALLPVR
jgi:Zn-dependent protease with chaperone function